MTAVASPPTFPQISRPAWGSIDGNNSMNPDEARGMFAPRKPLSRTNSSGSISSTSSNSSASTVLSTGSQVNGTPVSTTSDLSQWSANTASRKRPRNQPWPSKGEPQPDFSRLPASRPNGMVPPHGPLPPGSQVQMAPQGQMMRTVPAEQLPPGQPVLYLLSLNGTFERKTIAVPFAPESLRIGRQTNQKTIPTATNGFFDSKVLSRQHAEIFAERNGKIFIRDVKSSNGTFVNGTRLSQENRESEPHELSTADHLELGIDIVSEDQKTVVHHKVAAKVEHAGFMTSSNNVMDMNFGDLDPANSAMMTPGGAAQARGRTSSNASMGSMNSRMVVNSGMNPQGNMPQQRPFFLSPIATDQILKRLSNEMRSARLQAQDLGRTNSFVNTLLSKNDVKDLEKPEAPEPPKAHLNGGIPFRPDPKTRFSEPPAPPPQQPLPEKPNVAGLKRGSTERPKSGPPEATSPVRQANMSQIVQLTEALNNAKRDMDTQTARMRELESMLQKEREARELAESLAKRLEETASSHMNGVAVTPVEPVVVTETVREIPNPEAGEAIQPTTTAVSEPVVDAAALQSRLDTMDNQMTELRGQAESWRQRCEAAESERDADRKTLAEMVVQLRAEEAQRLAAQKERRSRSRPRRTEGMREGPEDNKSSTSGEGPAIEQSDGSGSSDNTVDEPTLSRASTITPLNPGRNGALSNPRQLQAGLPYASALGVVLVGMGLMAYINGWQAPPPPIDHR